MSHVIESWNTSYSEVLGQSKRYETDSLDIRMSLSGHANLSVQSEVTNPTQFFQWQKLIEREHSEMNLKIWNRTIVWKVKVYNRRRDHLIIGSKSFIQHWILSMCDCNDNVRDHIHTDRRSDRVLYNRSFCPIAWCIRSTTTSISSWLLWDVKSYKYVRSINYHSDISTRSKSVRCENVRLRHPTGLIYRQQIITFQHPPSHVW